MGQCPSIILASFGVFWLLGFGGFSWISHLEGERRAARVSFAVALVGAVIFFFTVILPISVQWIILGILLLTGGFAIILFFLPIGKVQIGNDIPNQRFDERKTMFARNNLKPGTPNYKIYYAEYPEHRADDDHTRSLPGLFSPLAKYTNPFHTASMRGSFGLTNALWNACEGSVAEAQQTLPVEQMTTYISDLARYFGALDVGVTQLQPYHVYSHNGRGLGVYGDAIEIKQSYAIVFTVEMDFEMVGTGPQPPSTMESARQYAESARVAVQLAHAINHLGYSAQAHIDGNYEVIAPLVARDAGLGEIGRMTLMMTPKQGPRVRLGVVTTDLKLTVSSRKADASVIDFCNICKKCAECCPSKSIPLGERQEIDGALRWKLNEVTCFRYWCVVGTDCGRCLAVCPYSHPDNLAHNIIRWGISRSGAFRRFALWLDDLFYGKRPEGRAAPDWTRVE